MTGDQVVYITPDDASWALSDHERLTVERDNTYPPYTDGWFFICCDNEVVFRLHKDEIVALHEFATTGEEE